LQADLNETTNALNEALANAGADLQTISSLQNNINSFELEIQNLEAAAAEAEATKAEMDAVQPGQDVTDDQGNTYTKKDDGQGFVFKAKDPKPVTTKDYEIPGGRTVQVGPRAGVMAPQPPSSAAESFKQYGRF